MRQLGTVLYGVDVLQIVLVFQRKIVKVRAIRQKLQVADSRDVAER